MNEFIVPSNYNEIMNLIHHLNNSIKFEEPGSDEYLKIQSRLDACHEAKFHVRLSVR